MCQQTAFQWVIDIITRFSCLISLKTIFNQVMSLHLNGGKKNLERNEMENCSDLFNLTNLFLEKKTNKKKKYAIFIVFNSQLRVIRSMLFEFLAKATL